jgi:hypothetical protein
MIYRGPDFLGDSYVPPLSSQLARPATHMKTGKERQGGEGVGEEPDHTAVGKPDPL